MDVTVDLRTMHYTIASDGNCLEKLVYTMLTNVIQGVCVCVSVCLGRQYECTAESK